MQRELPTIVRESIQPRSGRQSSAFGSSTFGRQQIEQCLSKKQAANWLAAIDGRERIERDHLDVFAEVLKEWAIRHGATHFTHWFQPLTGFSAEKHDSFLSSKGNGVIEELRGKELLQGEPDASSFPSGGLRSTESARGYTVWDPRTPPFLYESAGELTLAIPSLFFSWKGEALDAKIPLLRSEEKLQTAVLRLLHLADKPATIAFPTLGPEQEYFAIDRDHFCSRPDLVLAGRTVYGAKPAKGQELEDHYFSNISDRTLAFMRDFEEAALLLGIPLKTRHNEVAPAQHEVAPIFERASIAADHNLLLMQLMRQHALRHDLACLFHEKPFLGINGSGKHCNWSIATDTGLNLLDPREDSFVFIVLLTAILSAVHEHAPLLRASIGSAGNDWRLGGSEAPPTILSIYLGEELEGIVNKIIHGKNREEMRRDIDLGLSYILLHKRDTSDRNRTSFFAFTGNKFEFRAVGSSQNVSWPVTILNAIVADSLQHLLDEIEECIGPGEGGDLLALSLPVLRKTLRAAEPVLFSGNGYSREWEKEAAKRGLSNIRKSFHAFAVWQNPKIEKLLSGILSAGELHSRHEIAIEQYVKQMTIECNLMIELFRERILPAAIGQQKEWAESLSYLSSFEIKPDLQIQSLNIFVQAIEEAISFVNELEEAKEQGDELAFDARGKVLCELAHPRMEKARKAVDRLEGMVDHARASLPKYSELLFL
jgi:glutamine synthetase